MIFNTDNRKIYTLSQAFRRDIQKLKKEYGEVKKSSSLYIYPVSSKRVTGIYINPNTERKETVLKAIYGWTLKYYDYEEDTFLELVKNIKRFIEVKEIGNPKHDNPLGINLSLFKKQKTTKALANLLAFIEVAYIGNLRLIKQKPNRPYIKQQNLKENFEYLMNKLERL